MYGILNLNWKPSAASTEPAAGQAPAIIRGDSYVHVFTFTEDGDPFTITGTVNAQIRPEKLGEGDVPGAPLASFACEIEDNTVTVELTPEQTLDLPSSAFWDLQQVVAGRTFTLLAGKVAVLDDVTRL